MKIYKGKLVIRPGVGFVLITAKNDYTLGASSQKQYDALMKAVGNHIKVKGYFDPSDQILKLA